MDYNVEKIKREIARYREEEQPVDNEEILITEPKEAIVVKTKDDRVEKKSIAEFREEFASWKDSLNAQMKEIGEKLDVMRSELESNKLGRPCIYKKNELEMKADFDEGLSYRQIATKYKCSISTVYKYIHL